MHLRELVAPECLQQVVGSYHLRVSGERPSIRFTTTGMHKDGSRVHLEVHGASLQVRGRPAVVGVGINITEQVRQQEDLRASRERLRELASYINTMREEQRARIARELHDVVGGMLTSMKLDIQRIDRRVTDPAVKGIVDDLLGLVADSIAAVREISEDLRPGVLDHLGLHAALQSALRQFSARTEVRTRLSPEHFDVELSQSRATTVYRIFQEALTNIARHAQATAVEVGLRAADGELFLDIVDDGQGLERKSRTGKSIGLVGMSERARELGGSLSIGEGDNGRGTRIALRIPLEAAS
jgi:signal transduction histidine kinase